MTGSGSASGSTPGQSGEVHSAGERMLEAIVTRSHVMRPSELPVLLHRGADALGARDALLYLVDHEQRWLVPLTAPEREVELVSIDGTIAGRAFRTSETVHADDLEDPGAPVTLWVPVVDGAERLGVIRLVFDDVDEPTLTRSALLASLLAEFVMTRCLYGDSLVVARRLKEMTLAAELRWSQLPPLTVMAPRVGIAGLLEPAYDIAGDAFDYAVNDDACHVAIFDAMGHGLEASVMASLAVAAYRHGRRQGMSLTELYESVDAAVASQFGEERFVTAQFGLLDPRTGRLEWISAGHPPPVLLRQNHMVGELACKHGLPLGLGGVSTDVGEVDLEPGDRVLFYSDGVVEARSPEGELFGVDRLVDLLERAASSGQTLPETMRRLVHSVLEHQQDRLQDDATVLLLQWPGGESESDGPESP